VIKAIFWDNDGVLVDTEELYFRATKEVLKGVGIDLTPQQYAELFLVHSMGAWHLVAERGYSAAEVQRLRELRNARYGEMLDDSPLVMDGITTTLEALHGHYMMGIVTSSRRDHFDIIHRTTGLLGYFDFVLTADDCTYTKPHPELYLKAVERSGKHPDECLAIEDSARGLAAATAAGIKCVIVPTPLTEHSDFAGAHRVITHIADLRGLLPGANPNA
jgi:HAD superfamily hydrolase (TIGR01509 family)